MDLETYHRALVALCFADGEPPTPAMALYRDMVRSRFVAMAKVAYRSSFMLEAAALSAAFDRYLAARPPRTPRIREYIGDFAQYVESEHREIGARTLALVRFEAAKWQVGNAPDPARDEPLREVDFTGELVLNGTLEVLELDFTLVDDAGRELASPEPAPQALLVYRRPGLDDVRWYTTTALLGRVLLLARQHSAPLSKLLPAALDQLGMTGDQALLESLAVGLELAVERAVVYGVRA